jgi:hypothetical protein
MPQIRKIRPTCPCCGSSQKLVLRASGYCSIKCKNASKKDWRHCLMCQLGVGMPLKKSAKALRVSRRSIFEHLKEKGTSSCDLGKLVRKWISKKKDRIKQTETGKRRRLALKEKTGYSTTEKERQKQKERDARNKSVSSYREKRRIMRRHQRERRKYSSEHTSHRIQQSLMGRLRKFMKYNKRRSFIDFCGCSSEELRKHLESQFVDGMSWENYGIHGWHIDHIMPCSAFNLQDDFQAKTCFNWKNLRPLWASDNIAKSNKITLPQINLPLPI